MAVLEVSQLDKTGVITDVNEYLLAPESFSAAYNVKFGNGSVESAKGYVKYGKDFVNDGEVFKKVKGIADKLYFFMEDKMYIMTATAYNPIDYIAGFSVTDEFYCNPLSNLPVMVSDGSPFGIKDDGTGKNEIFKLDGWGANMKARNVVSYKGYLVAFGVQLDGNLLEDTVFWSDIAAPDTYPTDWGFEMDGDNINIIKPVKGSQGGYNQLNAIGGSIVAAHEFGDHLYLFTEKEIFRMSFIGGNAIFKFQKVLTGKGATSPNSVIALENGLAVIGSNDIYLFNGGQAQSISNSRINNYLSEKLLSGIDILMIRDFNEKQLLIFFRNSSRASRSDSEGFTEAIVYDWVSNTFSFRDATYTQFQDITEYRADSLFDEDNRQWPEMTYEWDKFDNSWQSELKYGTGVIAIRPKQVLIIHRGTSIVHPDDSIAPIPWNLKRKFYNTHMGYDERGIFRILSIKLRGVLGTNINAVVNGTIGKKRGSDIYFRETGKEAEVSLFGSGQMSLPAYEVEHSLIGRR